MSNWSFRFVHAADFRLETPLCGAVELPGPLREAFCEAPWWAAQRVFETALAEHADFVVLAGGVLHPTATGPRGPLFLVEQFERLAERGIGVYWAGGRDDTPETWPAEIKLPPNVCFFPSGEPQGVQCQREGAPLAYVVGASRSRERKHRAGEFAPDPGGLFSIAAVNGNVSAEALRDRPIDYWAMGGNPARNTLFSSPHTAHYPGTPQGRSPAEAGPHGCTLVQVDEERRLRTTFLPCDLLRWQVERIAVEPGATREQLQTRLHDRLSALKESQPGIDLLVAWTVAGHGPLLAELRQGTLAVELLEGLRAEHGRGSPAAWSVSLTAEPPAVLPPEWYEQESIRSDFLRRLRAYQTDATLPLDLAAYLGPAADEADGLHPAVLDDAARESVLREAALLGVDLLSGEGA